MSRKNQPTEGEILPVSKSQKRRDALETLSLASRLVDTPAARLAGFPLEPDVFEAIEETRNIRARVARKRQLHYLAKLLRRSDEEPILAALEALDNEARQLVARQHRSESWRDHLLQHGDVAVGQLLGSRRDVDSQAMRTLVRNARREASQNKPPASARALFRMLRELDEAAPLPALPG